MAFRHITVLGTGVLGAQIAFQSAYHGFDVVAWDIDAASIDKARQALSALARRYLQELKGATPATVEAALARIAYATDMKAAVAQADLVIEAIPEQLALKRKVYAELGAAAPAHTVFASNSSTLLPSAMADASGRPEKFIALHFANEIWRHNLAEVMGHAGTDPQVHAQVVDFAKAIGMVPIELHKERPGYVLNSLLVPLLDAAGSLLVDGIASPQDVDKAWCIGTGAPVGPFRIYDIVGLNTAYNISAAGGPKSQAFARYLKANYIDHGKLGVASGEGFYTYPKPV